MNSFWLIVFSQTLIAPGAIPSKALNESDFQGSSFLGNHERFATRELCEDELIKAVFDLWPKAGIRKHPYDGVIATELDVYNNWGVTYRHVQCVQLLDKE
jgi:hypothetical protein